MVRVPTHREPSHAGEMLLEEFLRPMNLSQRDLAEAIHVPYQRVNELDSRWRGFTPSTALQDVMANKAFQRSQKTRRLPATLSWQK